MPDSQLGRVKLSVKLRVRDTHPWNETLVKANEAAARPDGLQCLHHRLRAVRSHLGLYDLQGLAKCGDLRPGGTASQ